MQRPLISCYRGRIDDHPIYDTQETGVALEALEAISTVLPEPFLLVGGWAVYLTVNESYGKRHGVSYLGSRDIDVCFHIDPKQDIGSLRNSTFAQALEVVRREGYSPHGSYRFCKMIRRDDGAVITEEEARALALHELTYLYVDMMVDHIHPLHKEVFRCEPIDEPIAATIFAEGSMSVRELRGFQVHIPDPPLLLATKLCSIPNRQKDDKLWKDACDIYAIIWHSPEKFSSVLNKVKKHWPSECAKAHSIITKEVAVRAAHHLGIDVDEFIEIIDFLIA